MVYVANASADIVRVIATATNTVKGTIAVARAPNGVAVRTDGKTVYVTDFSNGTVTPIDTATNMVGTPIPIKIMPEILPGIISNGNALLATGLTFIARTSCTLASTLASGPVGFAVRQMVLPFGLRPGQTMGTLGKSWRTPESAACTTMIPISSQLTVRPRGRQNLDAPEVALRVSSTSNIGIARSSLPQANQARRG